ncbi:hypothetical protein RUMHYD_03675 [Blautia hydrogenotrophica DSM 10507]|uniref:Uncharacterized protein n=1 Tax=Blautia hydrogenotrophica (strain DSM 10507 / JCM 14656 / S5a33) TaxID=476272 RepID=C0CS09_BLAHS|nr:hypothetical protein RUMHYD_03675 [Blautia hydrogenotrophica DSM 10507]
MICCLSFMPRHTNRNSIALGSLRKTVMSATISAPYGFTNGAG